MQAAVLKTVGDKLTVEDVDDPVAGPGEALVRVRAVGLCGTDLKLIAGIIPGISTPLILGHEVAGELVDSAGGYPAGQRVAAYIFQTCNRCRWCTSGQQNLCPVGQRIGFERNGGLAEKMAVSVDALVPFPDSLSYAAAAVSMDAVLSPWRAIRVKGQVVAGDTVTIVGAGGLGIHAVQIARSLGARVAVIDPDDGHRQLAITHGAELAVAPDGLPDIIDWSGGYGTDAALESSGAISGFRVATQVVRAGGRVVCCGYKPETDFAFDSLRLAMSEIAVLGSRGGSRQDAFDALAAVGGGQILPIINGSGPLSEVNELIETLRNGEALGRLVVEL